MRGRLSSLCFCLFVSTLGLDASAASLSQQRQYYDQAKQALAKGDSGPYRRYYNALRDYPLEPYLAYDDLTHRLKSASNQEVEKFLAEHGDLPQISWMKLRWLRLLHLGLILFIAGQAWLGELCPLTTWEQDLRRLAGQDSYATSFIEHWLARLLYIEAPWWAFVLAYTTFAVVVAAAWVLVPPDSRRPA